MVRAKYGRNFEMRAFFRRHGTGMKLNEIVCAQAVIFKLCFTFAGKKNVDSKCIFLLSPCIFIHFYFVLANMPPVRLFIQAVSVHSKLSVSPASILTS